MCQVVLLAVKVAVKKEIKNPGKVTSPPESFHSLKHGIFFHLKPIQTIANIQLIVYSSTG